MKAFDDTVFLIKAQLEGVTPVQLGNDILVLISKSIDLDGGVGDGINVPLGGLIHSPCLVFLTQGPDRNNLEQSSGRELVMFGFMHLFINVSQNSGQGASRYCS